MVQRLPWGLDPVTIGSSRVNQHERGFNAFAVPAGFALLKLLIHLPVLHRYGWHHDELY